MKPFTPSRADGRSDKRVVYELVKDAEPEDRFDYDQLQQVLEGGLDDEIERGRIYRAVAAANKLLLREEQRFLAVVKGVGYRVARADEHVPYSLVKKTRAERQLSAGIDLLQQVRYDELNEAEKRLAQGTLLVFDGFYRAIKSSENRHDLQETTISALTKRVEELEQG
jgi:hypothetical protein